MKSERVGHYRIETKLGEGGVGEVYRALDPELGRSVALKRLRPELASRSDVVDRFRSEAKTLARLNHPNIATLYSFHAADDELFMVMEFVEGETLSSLIRRSRGLPLDEALPILDQALAGLGYAHGCGVVHRDIKGSNLILSREGVVKLMDFGIARVIGAERVTLLGQLLGTPEYMSPEQIRGEEIDPRSDLYSLGALFFALLTGEPPFRGASDFEVMQAQLEQPAPALRELLPSAPAEVEAAIARALEKDPARRFASTAEFRAALQPHLPLERDSLPIQRLPAVALDGSDPTPRSGVRLDDEAPTLLDGPQTEIPDEAATHTLVSPVDARPSARLRWIGAGLAAVLATAAGINWLGVENLPGHQAALRLFEAPARVGEQAEAGDLGERAADERLDTAPPVEESPEAAQGAGESEPGTRSAQKARARPAEETGKADVDRPARAAGDATASPARPRVHRGERRSEETPAEWTIRRQ